MLTFLGILDIATILFFYICPIRAGFSQLKFVGPSGLLTKQLYLRIGNASHLAKTRRIAYLNAQ
jgi:hypothetical protein